MSWTDERIAALTKFYGEGHSTSQIANRLNTLFRGARFTRNAVIGKIHRLGLVEGAAAAPKRRPTTAIRALQTEKSHPKRADEFEVRAALETPCSYDPSPLVRTFSERRPTGCLWPIGDPLAPDFHYCGATRSRRSYCAEHADIAFKAPSPAPAKGEERKALRDLRPARFGG